MRLALLPGLVDVVAFAWLVSANSQVKKVAAAAGVIGVVRVALPHLAVGFYAARSGGQGSDSECAISVFLLIPVTALMLAVWVVTALVAAFMLWRVTKAASAQPG
jgi:Na+/phosphate symporter